MGNFYTNITVRGPRQAEVAATLTTLGRRAFVAPTTAAGCTTVFDAQSESQDPAVLGALAATLSARLACPALAALNHDDSILALALYESGALVTEYSSDAPAGVDGPALARAFGAGALPTRLAVSALLHGPRPVFEVVRHRALAGLLGLPTWVAGSGYRYIAEGDVPPALPAPGLAHVPPPRA